MRNAVKKILLKYGSLFCAVSLTIVPYISEKCRIIWYQPKEPDGFEEFIGNVRGEKQNENQ